MLASVQDNVPSDSSPELLDEALSAELLLSELLDDDEGKELSAALDAADELTLDGIELISSAELELDATELTTELTDELLAAGRELLEEDLLPDPPQPISAALNTSVVNKFIFIFNSHNGLLLLGTVALLLTNVLRLSLSGFHRVPLYLYLITFLYLWITGC